MTKGAWKPTLLAAMMLAVAPSAGQAHPGDLDPAFSTDGLGQYPIARQAGTGTIPADVVPRVSVTPAGFEPDGDVVVGGTTAYSWDCSHVGCQHSQSFLTLARVRPNGELDPGFGDGGAVETALGFETKVNYGPILGPVDLAVQDDGRIVAEFGVLADYEPIVMVARFLADGQLDHSFSGDGISAPLDDEGNPQIEALAIQDDGGIVLAGNAEAHNYSPLRADSDFLLARVLPNGDPDPAFGGGDGARTYDFGIQDQTSDVALDDLGRIVLGGIGSHAASFEDVAFSIDFAVARFLSDGSPDPEFSDDGYARIDLMPDRGSNAVFGDLTVAGNRPVILAAAHPEGAFGFEGIFTALARLDASGRLDSTFGSGGVQHLEQIGDLVGPGSYSIDAQTDGSLLVGGGLVRTLLLGRLLPTGAPDPGFGDSGWVVDYPPAGFAAFGASGLIAAGDRAVVAGTTFDGPPRVQLARLRLDAGPPDDRDADGVLDPGDRCPGVYAPGGRHEGCPPPFSLRVTLEGPKPGSVWGKVKTATINCVPLKMGIFRERPGRNERVAQVLQRNIGFPDDPFVGAVKAQWSIARSDALRRGGRLYVRAAPRFDPTVGDCEGDRSKTLKVPGRAN